MPASCSSSAPDTQCAEPSYRCCSTAKSQPVAWRNSSRRPTETRTAAKTVWLLSTTLTHPPDTAVERTRRARPPPAWAERSGGLRPPSRPRPDDHDPAALQPGTVGLRPDPNGSNEDPAHGTAEHSGSGRRGCRHGPPGTSGSSGTTTNDPAIGPQS